MSTQNRTNSSAESTGVRLLARVRDHLEAERDRLNEQIGSYPSPIPACDAQFNYLLEKRTRISGELSLVDQLQQRSRADNVNEPGIEKLVAEIRQIDAELAKKVMAAFNTDSER
ncbi:MAG: hypothetical protein AMJ54_06565 [Deltaproteobacteria bacterium SG8_13]|nr:MAG: hypothetical protein AMJ54_06565 [Deltaproteobacteria bacterium SG8_13]